MFIVELVYKADLAAIDGAMRTHPFCKLGLAEFRIIEFRVSQRADDLEARISKE